MLWKCLRKENHVAIVWMKGDNYAAIEPPPSTDNQEDPKEHDFCKFLYENVRTGKYIYNIYFFLKISIFFSHVFHYI